MKLDAKLKALEDFTLDGFASVRDERNRYRTALKALRRGESEECDCAQVAGLARAHPISEIATPTYWRLRRSHSRIDSSVSEKLPPSSTYITSKSFG